MDEAASRIRMEVESKPEEIENLDRRIIQLKIEREALKKEQDTASKDRLAKLEEELANLEQQSAELTQRWQAEKEKIAGEAKIKEQLDAARLELEQAQRSGDLAKAGELQYGRIPQLEKQLADAQAASQGRDAARGSHRPGHRRRRQPLDRNSGRADDGRRAREAAPDGSDDRRARDRPGGCGEGRVRRRPPRPRRAFRTRTGRSGSFLFLGPTGVGKTELTKALAEFLFDDSSARWSAST